MVAAGLEHYWSGDFLVANGFIALNVLGALLLGMLVGYERSGFYAAAVMLAILCMVSISLLRRLEECLPGRATLDVSLSFCRGSMPSLDEVAEKAARSGYHIVCNSLVITYAEEMLVWRFAAVALDRTRPWRPRGWRRSAPSRKTWRASRLPLCGTDHQWRQRRTSAALTCRKAPGVDGSH